MKIGGENHVLAETMLEKSQTLSDKGHFERRKIDTSIGHCMVFFL